MKEKIARFMQGRYGSDGFNKFLLGLTLILLVLSMFKIPTVGTIAFLLLILVYFRMFSRNTAARYRENVTYYNVRNKLLAPFQRVKRRFSQRKTHRFYRCPVCKKELRVPKGKGLILVKCPCGHSFQKRT